MRRGRVGSGLFCLLLGLWVLLGCQRGRMRLFCVSRSLGIWEEITA